MDLNAPPHAAVVIVQTVREDVVRVPVDMIGIGDPFVRGELPNPDDAFHYDFGWRPVPGWIFWDDYMEKCRRAARLHRRCFNHWFCDGHIESEIFKKPFAATDGDLQRWNSDNLPHRDRWFSGTGR
jgi:hypothetical protein